MAKTDPSEIERTYNIRKQQTRFVYVMFYCVFVTFPCGVLGQVRCLIVSISDLCLLSYFIESVYEN